MLVPVPDVVQLGREKVTPPVLDQVAVSPFTGTPAAFVVTVAVTGSFVPP
jgi:hypothetical protein